MPVSVDFEKYQDILTRTSTIRVSGKVARVVGLVVEGIGPDLSVGGICDIYPKTKGLPPVQAEVVGFSGNRILMMPLGELRGIAPGCHIAVRKESATVRVDDSILGRVIDAAGNPLDGKGPLLCKGERSLYADPINPMTRARISKPLDVGIRAINGLLTIGQGQRIGIMAGAGVGKSVLLGMMAKNTTADINVIGLIGERGRELREFIEKNLGEEGMRRSVVVVATSDQSPLLRVRASYIATSIAEHFRDQGKNVLLMMDSLTRYAMAQREIGLSVGEPPATKGYTPSVFASLPRLLERAGTCAGKGSITGLYTVLIEGDDLAEPISDASRAILDGHLFLSRRLAGLNHYPAIDLLNSISRVMPDVVGPEHMKKANRFRELYATYREAEDLINIGAYVKGSNARIDASVAKIDQMTQFLLQGIEERSDFSATTASLNKVVE